MRLPHQERLLHQARIFQQSEAFGEYKRLRKVAEHRLVPLGIRQARYFRRAKTLFRLSLAATNLTLVATTMGMMNLKASHLASSVAFRLVRIQFGNCPLPAIGGQYPSHQRALFSAGGVRLDL